MNKCIYGGVQLKKTFFSVETFLIPALALFCILSFFPEIGKAATKYNEVKVSNGGSISGAVKYVGDVPQIEMFSVDKDKKVCGHEPKPSEELIISKGKGIKNVFVYIKKIASGKSFEKHSGNFILNQKNCRFDPHILIVSTGAGVDLLNNDNVLHNLHSWSTKNKPFNQGTTLDQVLTREFSWKERIMVTCDIHSWMSSWIIVVENPYFALTDKNGKFKIDNIPPGSFELIAWQETLGRKKKKVNVNANEETEVKFEYTPKKSNY